MGRELVDKGRELLSAAPTGIDLQVPGTVGAPIVPFPRADTRSELLACVTSRRILPAITAGGNIVPPATMECRESGPPTAS